MRHQGAAHPTGCANSRQEPLFAACSFSAALTWTSLAVAAISVDVVTGVDIATPALAALALAWGVCTFWSAGGRFITAASLFGFGTALFVGLAGFLALRLNPTQTLLPAVSVSYFSAIWASTFFVQARPRRAPVRLVPLNHFSTLIIGASLVGSSALVAPSEVGDALFFAVVVLIMNSLAFAGRRAISILVGLVGATLYYLNYYDGFGRLTLGALGLAMAAILAPWFPGRWVKALVLVGLVPVLAIMAASRVSLVEARNPQGDNSNAGLGSVAAPMFTGARAFEIARSGMVESSPGHTYWASVVALVPRSIWPDKPVGWGAELTPYTRPELAGTIHSEAATGFIEPYWNFGFLGLSLAIPILGLAVRGIDRLIFRSYDEPLSENKLLIGTVGILLASSLPDLVWGGSFTFVVRGGFRAGFLLFPMFAFLLIQRRPRRSCGGVSSRDADGSSRPVDSRDPAVMDGRHRRTRERLRHRNVALHRGVG